MNRPSKENILTTFEKARSIPDHSADGKIRKAIESIGAAAQKDYGTNDKRRHELERIRDELAALIGGERP
jgi:hypothetical protein